MSIRLTFKPPREWFSLADVVPKDGQRVDLKHEPTAYPHNEYFGKVTVHHPNIHPCGWNDGARGLLVLSPYETKWRAV